MGSDCVQGVEYWSDVLLGRWRVDAKGKESKGGDCVVGEGHASLGV